MSRRRTSKRTSSPPSSSTPSAIRSCRSRATCSARRGDRVRADGEITIKGITRPATLEGTITGPAVDHFGATRVGLELSTVVDRTEFGITWNMPLPNGEPALSNDVTLTAELTLVAKEA